MRLPVQYLRETVGLTHGSEAKESLMTVKNRTGCMNHRHPALRAAPALAQTKPDTLEHVPLQKAIGQPGPDIVPSLIVMNARGARL
jgi:hypothetical protein